MKAIKNYLGLLLLCFLHVTSVNGFAVEYNCHTMFRVYPSETGHIKYLTDLRNSNDGLIFWSAIAGVGQTTDILVPPELIGQMKQLNERGIRAEPYYRNVHITFSQEISQRSTCSAKLDVQNWGRPTQITQMTTVSGAGRSVHLTQSAAPTGFMTTTTSTQFLTTGVYFTLAVQSQTNSLVLPSTEASAPLGTYISILPATSEHSRGGPLFNTTLWRFIPGQQLGTFVLTNKAHPKAVASFISDFMGFKSLQLSTDAVYAVGGSKYEDTVWKIVESEQAGFYRLKLASVPAGVVTYKQGWTSTGYHVFVEEYSVYSYQPTALWASSALFQLRPVEFVDNEPGPFQPLIPMVQTIVYDINLHTGYYYSISIRGTAGSVLIAQKTPNDLGGQYVELITKNLDLFASGSPEYNATQWKLSLSNVEGYFVLENRAFPDTLVTLLSKPETGATFVHLVSKESVTTPTAPFPDKVLWKIEGTKIPGQFRLRPKMFPTGIFTAATPTTNGALTQIADETLSKLNFVDTVISFRLIEKAELNVARQEIPDDDDEALELTFDEVSSGVYYTITLKGQPKSILTYSGEETAFGGKFVQLLLKNQNDYLSGGPKFVDSLWKLSPSEVPGFFTLENKAFPKSFTTFVETPIGDKVLLILTSDSSDYAVGGQQRDRVLWSILKTESQGYFRLHNKGSPHGYVTWKNDPIGANGVTMWLDEKSSNAPFYHYGGKWFSQVVFQLSAVELIEGVQTTEIIDDGDIGGDDELYVGFYYQLSMKAKSGSILGYSEKTTTQGNNFLLLWTSSLQLFSPGQQYYNDGLWELVPSEVDGYFTITNKRFPGSLITFTDLYPGSKYLQLVLKPTKLNWAAGGPDRDDALLSFVNATRPGYYVLQLKSFGEKGVITWKEETTTTGFYLQLDTLTENLPFYQPGGKWYYNTLFKFTRLEKVLPPEQQATTTTPSPPVFRPPRPPPPVASLNVPGSGRFMQDQVAPVDQSWTSTWYSSEGTITTTYDSDTYYTLGLASKPGTLVFTPQLTGSGGNYIQLATKNLDSYSPSGDKFADSNWKLIAVENGYYELVNRAFPQGLATFTTEYSGWKYFEYVMNEPQLTQYRFGGVKRDDAIFSLVPVKDVPYGFRLTMKSLPNGYITWKDETSTIGFYTHVDTDNTADYQFGGTRYLDMVFTIMPSAGQQIAPPASSSVDQPKIEGLLSGAYYKIGIKSKPGSILTYTYEPTSFGGRFVQLITVDTDDYLQGGKNYADSFWKITESEHENYYTLENKGYPSGILTSIIKYGLAGKYLKLSANPATRATFEAGKANRDKVLFKITPSELPGFYRIQFKDIPNGLLTWFSTDKTEHGYLVGIDDSSERQSWYELGGRWQDDTLFSFTFLEMGGTSSDILAPTHTDLKTNIYYTLSLKSKENSRLTFTKEDPKITYLQLATGKRLTDYKSGEKNYANTLWKLVQTDLEGYYTLENKGFGVGSVTTVQKRSVPDKYLHLINSKDGSVEPFLWHIQLSEQRGYYRLKLKSSPSGAFTWIDDRTDSGFYMRLDEELDTIKQYEDDEPWYDDVLFQFTPATIEYQDLSLSSEPVVVPLPDEEANEARFEVVKSMDTSGLFTGIMYHMRLRSEERSVITYESGETGGGGVYLQVVVREQDQYLTGGEKHMQALWKFTASEVAGYFTIANMEQSNALITYYQKSLFTAKYLQLVNVPNPKYQPGGSDRPKALFKFIPSEIPNYFVIIPKDLPTGYVTISPNTSPLGFHLQISPGSALYEKGGKSRDKVLFRILPAKDQTDLTATITYFNYDYPSTAIWETRKQLVKLSNSTLSNTNSEESLITLKFSLQRPIINRFEYKFAESFKLLRSTKIIGGIPSASNPTAFLNLHATIVAGEGLHLANSFSYTNSIDIRIPGQTQIYCDAFYYWIEDLELPFNSIVEIRTNANRPTRVGTIERGLIPGDIILEMYALRQNPNVEIVGVKNNGLFIKTSGTMIASYSTPIILNFDEKKIDIPPPLPPLTLNIQPQLISDASTPEEVSGTLLKEDDYDPIVLIPNTNIFTGIFYFISVKSQPGPVVTFSETPTETGGNFVELAYTDTLRNTDVFEAEKTNPKYFISGQYRFSLSEDSDFYTLRNRDSIGWVAQSAVHSTDGKMIHISRRYAETETYGPNGKYRIAALWKLRPTTVQYYYQFEVKKYPNGFVTLDNEKKSSSGIPLQIDNTVQHRDDFSPAGHQYDNSLFKLSPSNARIHGTITSFTYDVPSDEFIKSKLHKIALLSNITLANPTNSLLNFKLHVDGAEDVNNKLIYTFNQDFSFLFDYQLKAELAIPNNPPIKKGFNGGFTTGVPITIETEVDWSFTSNLPEIEVAARKTVMVNYYYQRIDELQVPFTALVELQATAVRATKDGRIVLDAPIDTPDYVLQYLKDKNLQGFVSHTTGNTVFVKISGSALASYVLPASDFSIDDEVEPCPELSSVKPAPYRMTVTTPAPTAAPTTTTTTTTTTPNPTTTTRPTTTTISASIKKPSRFFMRWTEIDDDE